MTVVVDDYYTHILDEVSGLLAVFLEMKDLCSFLCVVSVEAWKVLC